MNRKILILIVTFIFLYRSSSAQISLLENPIQEVYPIVYFPNRIIYLKDMEELNKDLKLTSNFVNTYIFSDLRKDFILSEVPKTIVSKLDNTMFLFYTDKNIDNLFVTLNTTFHGGWGIYYLDSDNLLSCKETRFLEKFNLSECEKDYSFLEKLKFILGNKSDVAKNTHIVSNGLNNTWEIHKAKKGTYLIYFKVQTPYILSIFISLFTTFLAILYLIYSYLPNFINFYLSKIRNVSAIKNKC